MKILHTSDWHIGHALYGNKRHDEHENFLAWLTAQITERHIDALIVSGDIFDTGTPGGQAQSLYYNFLQSIIGSYCTTVVIVAGNHDSPRLLEAPSGVLKRLRIHVVGLPKDPADHVIEIHDADGEVKAICCAVPYLRKNEMVKIEDDDLSSDQKIVAATRRFYHDVTTAALTHRQNLGTDIPIIATGHLFAQGATRTDGDGVRELYVGTLGQVSADIFPQSLDYVALGHIHSEQRVKDSQHIRYSGSPLHMSFSEIGKKKYIIELNVKDDIEIDKIEVPVFQKMRAISGGYEYIMQTLGEIKQDDIWLEVTYTGQELLPELSADIYAAIKGGRAQVLSIRNTAVLSSILKAADNHQTLDTMDVQDVFLKCIENNTISEKHKRELIDYFNEIVAEVEEREECV